MAAVALLLCTSLRAADAAEVVVTVVGLRVNDCVRAAHVV